MNKDFTKSDEIDQCFEDVEDCLEYVSEKVEDAVCYWQIMSRMFLSELDTELSRQMFYEMCEACFDYYDQILQVTGPSSEGPFQIKGTIPRF